MTPSAKFLRRLSAVFYGVLCLSGLGILTLIGLFFLALADLPRVPDPLSRIIETPPTEIYAATGERVLVLGGRETIPLNRVSSDFIQAILATEDHRFWQHHGINKLRTLRALWVTLTQPGRVEGASTITQQLSKNLFFSFKRSFKRKFQELLVALQIEARFAKEEILEAYINQIPFGVGAYGVEQAARIFFGIPASDLSLAQSALLAGLPKSPTRYNPFRHLERAARRQGVVLKRMVTVGSITRVQAMAAARADLHLRTQPAGPRSGSYFLDYVLKQLERRYGAQAVYHGGLKVTTSLDPHLQLQAVEALSTGLSRLDGLLGIGATSPGPERVPAETPQGAMAVVETHSGAIKALVGGRDYYETEYNRAVQHHRLPGSGFKPFVYYTALESLDFNPATVLVDRPVKIPVAGARDWSPRNFERRHVGPIVMKKALMRSVNTIAAQLVQRSGPRAVIATARRCGITSPLEPVYSVALGTSGVSPLEMASSFATFAAGGLRYEPFCIWRVDDALGRVLEEHLVSGERVLDAALTYQLVDMLQGVVNKGTGAAVRRAGFDLPAGGKTGTSNAFKDAWFTGFTPTLSASVWVGYDRGMGMRDVNGVGVTGGRGAAPIWADFMIRATAGEPPREFAIPAGVHFESVDAASGLRAPADAADPLRVALRQEQRLPDPQSGLTPPGPSPDD